MLTSNSCNPRLSVNKTFGFITTNKWPPKSPDLIKSRGLQHLRPSVRKCLRWTFLCLLREWTENSYWTVLAGHYPEGNKKIYWNLEVTTALRCSRKGHIHWSPYKLSHFDIHFLRCVFLKVYNFFSFQRIIIIFGVFV